jgi:hypothetical protein
MHLQIMIPEPPKKIAVRNYHTLRQSTPLIDYHAHNQTRKIENKHPLGTMGMTNLLSYGGEPITDHLCMHTPDWCDNESCGEAACSRDENTPPSKNLQDFHLSPSALTDSTLTGTMHSQASQISFLSCLTEPSSSQALFTVEKQFQPGEVHLDIMLEVIKRLLDYVQELDSYAMFMSRGYGPDNMPLPHLIS